MATQREVKLKKIFPEFGEKIVKDYRCALFLDFHHPGHLILTQNNMYFYSTKNIKPPLPNPLAVHSSFKDLSSIEKAGLDIIVIKKGDEEIILDSFQFRNETFDSLQRGILTAKGKVEKIIATESKEEYLPLDIEAKSLWNRSIDGLPFFNDLGLLSLNYTITESDKEIFVGQQLRNLKTYERLKQLLVTLGSTLNSNFNADEFQSAFDKYFENVEDEKVKYSIDKPTVIEFLKQNGGENTPLVKCLKACIHPITGAVIRIKTAMTSYYPTKDKSWEVHVTISDSQVNVLHIRQEECVKGAFQIEWKETLTFDRKMSEMTNVTLFVTDLIFNPDTREPTRYEIQQLLKDFLPPAEDKTNTVWLPSFVDLSNQKLTEIPAKVFTMTKLQTLYLHFNQIDNIPDEIMNLKNLQVLYLNSNKFTSFPSVVCELSQLQELHLGSNKITEIPSEITKLQALRELSLSYNLLSGDLPKEVCALKNLRKLYLHNNYLESLPHELADLPLLKTIMIHNNQKMTGTMKTFEAGDSEAILKYLREQKP